MSVAPRQLIIDINRTVRMDERNERIGTKSEIYSSIRQNCLNISLEINSEVHNLKETIHHVFQIATVLSFAHL